MGQMEARGKLRRLQGRGMEIVGVMMGDSALELDGARREAEGAAQEKRGRERTRVATAKK